MRSASSPRSRTSSYSLEKSDLALKKRRGKANEVKTDSSPLCFIVNNLRMSDFLDQSLYFVVT